MDDVDEGDVDDEVEPRLPDEVSEDDEDDSVEVVRGRDGDGDVYVVGTAHVSERSVDDVERAIDVYEPDVVAVELDEKRYKSIKGDAPSDLDPADLLEGNKPFELLVYWLLSYLQTKLGDRFGIEPGAEMLAAIETAEERGLPVALVDRDINVTVARLWKKMSLWEKLKFVGGLVVGVAGLGRAGDEMEAEIDEMMEGDVVEVLIEEFREFSPRGAEALIDERDAYIASNLDSLRREGKSVVAVVGAGHRAGILAYLEDPESIPEIEPLDSRASGRRFSVTKAVGYGVSVVVIGMFVLLVLAGADNRLLGELFVYWFLINGVFAFAGAKLAGGHWTSASVGGLVAWMTSINPALAPGWFAGYFELRHRDVSVKDIDEINEILSDAEASTRELLGRMNRIPTFKLLLVVAFTNLGSVVATALFLVVVLPWVGADVDMTALLWEGLQNGWLRIEGLLTSVL
ncbi:MAG: TraB/GumN family protein [Halobacteriales archaeon]